MDFIEKNSGGSFSFDDSNRDEKELLFTFNPMLKEYGIDENNTSTGVFLSPDFGYFDYASRFWRASLCVYLSGINGAFWEKGIGYAEPWFFNARHSFELFIKGFIMFSEWYDELHNDILANDIKEQINHINHNHNLESLYFCNYKEHIINTVNEWDVDKVGEKPNINRIILSDSCEKLLREIAKVDTDGFRFRYPSMKKTDTLDNTRTYHELQKYGWEYNSNKIYEETGLPKESGVYFDHLKVINRLHELYIEFYNIANYHGAIWSCLGEYQDELRDVMNDYYRSLR